VRKLLLLVALLATTALSASTAQAITYGTVDVNNTYSYVGGLVTDLNRFGEPVEPFVYCSGTLISPTVFLTAAHCNISARTGNDIACVTFDVTLSKKSKLYCGTFIASPYYSQRQNDPNDLAVIRFPMLIQDGDPAKVLH